MIVHKPSNIWKNMILQWNNDFLFNFTFLSYKINKPQED